MLVNLVGSGNEDLGVCGVGVYFSVRIFRLRSTMSGSGRLATVPLEDARVSLLLGEIMVFALGVVTLGVPGQEPGGAKLMFLFGFLDSKWKSNKVFVCATKASSWWTPDDAKCKVYFYVKVVQLELN